MSLGESDLPYRSRVASTIIPTASPSATDERELSTLQIVRADLSQAIAALNKDFNAFTIGKDKLPAERAQLLLHEVEVRQAVYDIIAPLIDMIDGTVSEINEKYKK